MKVLLLTKKTFICSANAAYYRFLFDSRTHCGKNYLCQYSPQHHALSIAPILVQILKIKIISDSQLFISNVLVFVSRIGTTGMIWHFIRPGKPDFPLYFWVLPLRTGMSYIWYVKILKCTLLIDILRKRWRIRRNRIACLLSVTTESEHNRAKKLNMFLKGLNLVRLQLLLPQNQITQKKTSIAVLTFVCYSLKSVLVSCIKTKKCSWQFVGVFAKNSQNCLFWSDPNVIE